MILALNMDVWGKSPYLRHFSSSQDIPKIVSEPKARARPKYKTIIFFLNVLDQNLRCYRERKREW